MTQAPVSAPQLLFAKALALDFVLPGITEGKSNCNLLLPKTLTLNPPTIEYGSTIMGPDL